MLGTSNSDLNAQAARDGAGVLGARRLGKAPPAVRTLAIAACISSGCITSGCITSGPGEYGISAEVRDLDLPLCPDGMIDDGEDDNSQIITTGERGGYWFTFKDEMGSTVEPEGDFRMTAAAGGPPGNKFAANIKGKIATAGPNQYPYVGIGFNLANPKSPYDAGQATAVQFWAKANGKLRFQVPDTMTDPSGERCTDCYNHFGVEIFVPDTWQRYTVPFAKMKQQDGWGDRAPKVAKNQLLAIQWQFTTPGADYDVWIDNVAFVGCE